MPAQVPTVDDLRVKLCYICREEETHDNPEDPPRQWTHPCNCTLVAHQSCLLEWIQTSQADAARAPNALKCPQCGARYEIDSYNPIPLKILDAGNKVLFVMGRMVTAAGLTALLVSFGTGIYIVSTAYGAYALKQILGKEMFDLLLTEDPSVWPWHAFFNLPLIPISLILSRTPLPTAIMPILPILLAWPSSTPVGPREISLINNWRPASTSPHHSWSTWPPSPAFIGLFILPFVRAMYKRGFARFSHWVLSTSPSQRPQVMRYIFNLNGPFPIRIGANIEARNANANANANANNANANAPRGDAPQGLRNAAGDAALALAAEGTIHITGSSLGRIVGGALAMPAISSFMGALLGRLSARSPLLRRFLAVRPTRGAVPPPLGPWSYADNWAGLSVPGQIGVAARLLVSVAFRGTRTWTECDPVWWRNSIGLGVFIVAKDCLHLLHLWYAKAELGTRTIRNKSFEGIDIRELDLIDPGRHR
ncbi:hypothetical protein FIBSPDRAFT_811513 [Athelia psychrophila]|uniref:RING-CH-type domain-containing protein n=1 Tax=Athelia psychrophila TaxID=1759441 RepID=A0A166W2C0_9AGAM|nr:hypothetical protein FIBSPDRAFT_811513 [Fibularhizoctonia sp. CBS 109695]